MAKRLAEYTDEELLYALVTRNQTKRAPNKITWSLVPLMATIGIGNDHHADVVIGDEDLAKLQARIEAEGGVSAKSRGNKPGNAEPEPAEQADPPAEGSAGSDDEVAELPPSST